MKHKTYVTRLQCTACNSILPIARKTRKRKSEGHIKTIYCPVCRDFTQHQDPGSFKWQVN